MACDCPKSPAGLVWTVSSIASLALVGLLMGRDEGPIMPPLLGWVSPARAWGGPARSTTGRATGQEPSPSELVREALKALAAHQSVSANLHQQIDLYQQQLIGNGVYRQGPPETNWMALDLSFKLGQRNEVFQQRCDGVSLWTCRIQGAARTVWRRELAGLREAASDVEAPHAIPPLAAGGVPRLLAALDQAFDFKSKKNGTLRTLPVYVVRGQWRAERLAKWLPEQKDAIAAGRAVDLSKLPPAIPDHVFVLLGREDLFPYRIEYGRDDPRAPEQSRTLVAMDLDDVVFDGPVNAGEFVFDPGNTPVVEIR